MVIAACIGLLFFFVYFFFNRQIMLLFLNRDSTEAIEVGHFFLTTVSPFYVVISGKLVADGVLRGKEKMGLFMISTFTDLTLRVGLAFAFASFMGSRGIWWAWPIGWGVALILSVAFCFVGKGKGSRRKASDSPAS